MPNVIEYVSGVKMVLYDNCKQEFTNIVNCIMHWTIDRELSMTLQNIASLMIELKGLDSSSQESFLQGGRQA